MVSLKPTRLFKYLFLNCTIIPLDHTQLKLTQTDVDSVEQIVRIQGGAWLENCSRVRK